MTDFARLVLDADTRGLKQGERDLDRLGSQASKTARDVDGAAVGMGSAFKRVGVAFAAAGIGSLLLDFGKKSVQAAIDAQEMESAFGVVFGNMADDVRKWAEETGNTLGRSTQEIQRSALAFQELFGKSLAPEQAAELSKQFAVLTQDLASFKNLSNEVAQQKLFSGLVGEAEPLRAVGVFLSETAVQAKAAELGLTGVNDVLTDQEKIVARAAIIQEQLANAQGDVERTSGSTANQIKTMNAAVEELQVAIGQRLLPQLTPFITLTAELVTMLANAAQQINITARETEDFVSGLKIVAGWVSSATSAFMGFLNSIGLTADRLRWLQGVASSIINPLKQVVSLFSSIGAAQRQQDRYNALGIGTGAPDFSMFYKGADLASVSAAKLNAPPALPSLAANFGKVGGAARSAGIAARAANDDFGDLYETLFPESITRRQRQTLEAIDSMQGKLAEMGISREEARRRALGIDGEAAVSQDLIRQGPVNGDVQKALDDYVTSVENMHIRTQKATQGVAESFGQMADRTLQALDRMVGAIRGGGFLDILSSVINLGLQLGGMGLFGSKIQANINAPAGARANGGQVSSGRTYLVGERGPELFTPQGHGRIVANDRMGAPTHVTVGIDPRNGNITAFVNGQIAANAPAIASAGAAIAQAQAAQSARRRVR